MLREGDAEEDTELRISELVAEANAMVIEARQAAVQTFKLLQIYVRA